MICQLVLEYFQLQLSDILFFSGGFQPFWDVLAFERPDGLSQAKKSQKGLRPPEKTKCLQASAENTPKKLTHHEKLPALFLSLVPYHIDAHSSMILYFYMGEGQNQHSWNWTMVSNDNFWWVLAPCESVLRSKKNWRALVGANVWQLCCLGK